MVWTLPFRLAWILIKAWITILRGVITVLKRITRWLQKRVIRRTK